MLCLDRWDQMILVISSSLVFYHSVILLDLGQITSQFLIGKKTKLKLYEMCA